jgi:hypothetical protein
MGSIVMKKELAGIKDHNGYWSFIFCVGITEGKSILNSDTFIKLIKTEYPDVFVYEFIVEENEIYTYLDENIVFNIGDKCK